MEELEITNTVSFDDWLLCWEDDYYYRRIGKKGCGDITGDYNECYLDGKCEGVTSQYWYDCYEYDAGCELYNGCTNYYCINTIEPTFYEFAECYDMTTLDIYECTD